MALLEEVMVHFYRKAKIEESLGRFCDFRIVDNALQNAARIAREIVSFRHPRISAVKLAVADPNRADDVATTNDKVIGATQAQFQGFFGNL